jgi:putative PIN family toxin of toxin-antitoxin system
MRRVVLDTNILVSANLKPHGLEADILSLALNDQIAFCVSGPILAEYEDVLRRPKFRFVTAEITRFLTRVRNAAKHVRPTTTVTVCADDPDNRLLECAETAKAHFLITGNKRHFPEQWKDTRIVTSREFLNEIIS